MALKGFYLFSFKEGNWAPGHERILSLFLFMNLIGLLAMNGFYLNGVSNYSACP